LQQNFFARPKELFTTEDLIAFILGVGVLSKTEPLSVQLGTGVPKHDNSGRSVTAEVISIRIEKNSFDKI